MKLKEVYDYLDSIFPFGLQIEWDNSGIQIGSLNSTVTGIVVTLDIDKSLLEFCKRENINLIISHHPLIFKRIGQIIAEDDKTEIVYKAISYGINVISAHTNVDIATGGLADYFAKLLGFEVTEPLSKEGFGRVCLTAEDMSLNQILRKLREKLRLEEIRYVEGSKEEIRKIGICPGSGGDLIEEAIRKDVDAYITGDIKYHHAKRVEDRIHLIDVGHYGSEIIFVDLMYEKLKNIDLRIVKHYIKNPIKTWR